MVAALERQISDLDCQIPVSTVYVGGGSPSYLPHNDLSRLLSAAIARFDTIEEVTVEINPDQADADLLDCLKSLGVNRLSIGAQSFHNDELAFLSRTYRADRIYQVVTDARAAGFENISLDLIFAIPGSTIASWAYSLQESMALGVEHISAYSLTVEKGTQLFKEIKENAVKPTSESLDCDQFKLAIELLEAGGLAQYEISNFAKPGFECKHNDLVWSGRPYIGIGPSAGGYFNGKRTTNLAGIRPYIEAVENDLSVVKESYSSQGVERACETAVLMLRRSRGIHLKEYKKLTGFSADDLFSETIADHVKRGNLDKSGDHISLTPQARLIADSVLCDFSAV
jgi:oxygen-independent coproporphyrinogen-3 oxidase